MRSRYLATIFIVAVMFSCSKSDNASNDYSTDYVTINPYLQTRATELSFEVGDMIGVTIEEDGASTLYAENYKFSYDGANFISDLLWYKYLEQTSTLMAYYPYVSGGSAPTSFTIKTDQTTSGAYTSSDLMGSIKTGVTPESSTSMVFSHLLSRIVVEIDNQSVYDVAAVAIGGSYATATFDLETLGVDVDQSSSKVSINAPLWDDGSYKAIVVPQSVALTFTLTLSDGRTVSDSKALVTLKSGGEYTANITLTDEDIEVELSGDINGWEDQGTIPDSTDDNLNAEVDGSIDSSTSSTYFMEYDSYFEYGASKDRYDIVTLSDGSTWMAQPLRYIPEGITPSTKASSESHMWYPYEIDYEHLVADDLVTATPSEDYIVVLTDDASIEEKGYLYDTYAAFGEQVTEDNYSSFEGAQGVCPTGWHIPSRADYLSLVGYSLKAVGESSVTNDSSALLYSSDYRGSSVDKFNDAGLNYQFTGYRVFDGYLSSTDPYFSRTMLQSTNTTDSDLYGELAISCYMTSTAYDASYSGDDLSDIEFFTLMSTFSSIDYPAGRLYLGYISAEAGQSIRCVKDK